jgi:nucleoside-diphosphate-sugar epimerase
MSRVLVTGGAGFVGSHTVQLLLERGHEIAVVVRSATSLERLGNAAKEVQLVHGDISEPAEIISRLPWTPDACAHLAWNADPRTYLVSHDNMASLAGSLHLLTALMAGGCSRFVAVGTCAEYRSAERPLTEESEVAPTTLYAASKLSLFLTSQRLAEQAGATVAWARLFHLYGPWEDERRLVPAAICSLLAGREFPASSGVQVRDYLHVTDAAGALCDLLERGAGGAVNISSGTPTTVRHLLEKIGRQVGRPELIRFGERDLRSAWDPPYVVGTNARLQAVTGWRPRYGLDAGIEQVVEWWKARS